MVVWNNFGLNNYLELELTPKIWTPLLKYTNFAFHVGKHEFENTKKPLLYIATEVNNKILAEGDIVCVFL
jgi:hypothetical protein